MADNENEQGVPVDETVLANLPISELSQVADGVSASDLLLISKPCDGQTETGYMSYSAKMQDVSAWMKTALGFGDYENLLSTLSGFLKYKPLLDHLLCSESSVTMDVTGETGPFVVSAMYQASGFITALGGYKLPMPLENSACVVTLSQTSYDNLGPDRLSSAYYFTYPDYMG